MTKQNTKKRKDFAIGMNTFEWKSGGAERKGENFAKQNCARRGKTNV